VAKKKKISYLGWGIAAALIGAGIAFAIIHKPEGTPIPYVKDSDAYDDNWGKQDPPDSKATVTHVLVSWEGGGVDNIKDPKRTKEQARKLIEEVWLKYKNDRSEENWKKLQSQFNEDTTPHNTYDIPGNLVQPFQDCGKSTKVGFARICESTYGYHLIRREK
jgi:hypothetical protein